MALFAKKDALEIIQGKVESFTTELTKANAAVEEAQAKVSAAQAAKEDAADQNDAAAFAAAKKQLAEAETALEMATMRKTRLVEKGAVPPEEVAAAKKEYDRQILEINAKACREIIDRLTALNDIIDTANAEARKVYFKEKQLCELIGIEFHPIMGSHVWGNYIAASSFRSWPSNAKIRNDGNLQRFAAQVKS